jgi:formylglycine-generating enzyme required for sulfatase activity/tRNA A-37 threonylcarbamoyl transferase component Bud32
MSQDPVPARGDDTASPNEHGSHRRPISEVLPTPGDSLLLERLEDHRARGARHSVGEKIATGGMGEILRVTDQDLGRDLAMKVLRRDFATRSEAERSRMLARFLEEAQITGQLHHPSIVPVHELSVGADGQPYFTMPLIRGWDFGEIIHFVRDGLHGWTLARALGIVLKVCEAVAYAHARGVIHRDIKPSNVRIGRFGETYLMDWGLARVLSCKDGHDLRVRDPEIQRSTIVRTDRSKLEHDSPDSPLITMDGEVVGTPNYMSPEQARGDSDLVGPRSDVYSLGALLYHLLAGVAPYSPTEGALSPRAVWSLVLEGPPKDLHELSPEVAEELVDICRKAMARDVSARYADAQEIALDIEAFLDRRPVKAHAPGIIYALRLACERNRKLLLVGAAAGVLLLGVSGWQWLRVREARSEERLTRQLSNDGLFALALQSEAGGLYPATPSEVARFDRWLGAADELIQRLPDYERELSRLPEGTPRHETIADHIKQLTALRIAREGVARTRESAASLELASLIAPADGWRSARDAVRLSDRYHDLELEPQIGLVPLWKNQDGLWEFWHVQSGKRPSAATSAEYAPQPEDGIILILVPGGRFQMGSPESERGRGKSNLEPLHSLALPPFFISRYEVTQGQWLRVMGENPSRYRPENTIPGSFSLLHPVESVNWSQAREFSARLDLRLPKESEWEYACRAGTQTAYYWGDDFDGMAVHENILDSSVGPNAPSKPADWTDGFVRHAPIGSFEPNGFGLYDMLGNVSEWCEDRYYSDPVAGASSKGDESPGITLRSYRGGSWIYPPVSGGLEANRAAFRQVDNERSLTYARGLRVARDCRVRSR